MNLRTAIPTFCACLALGLIAGCGGDDSEESSGGGGSTEEPSGGSSGGAEAKGGGKAVTVNMKNTSYVPMAVKVATGGTITWTNSDDFAHTVTKTGGPGPKFDSGDVEGGATFKQKFAVVGEIDYVCDIHPGQEGTITVE